MNCSISGKVEPPKSLVCCDAIGRQENAVSSDWPPEDIKDKILKRLETCENPVRCKYGKRVHGPGLESLMLFFFFLIWWSGFMVDQYTQDEYTPMDAIPIFLGSNQSIIESGQCSH